MFVTLTAAHGARQPLNRSVTLVERAWKRARWRRLKTQCGLLGVVSVVDVTHGAHGWHFHIHALVLARNQRAAAACSDDLTARYEQELAAAGYAVTDDTTDLREVHDEERLAAYISKSWSQKQNDGSETPMQLLERSMSGSKQAFQLFLEAFETFQGKHRGVMSQHLRRTLETLPPRHDRQTRHGHEEG